MDNLIKHLEQISADTERCSAFCLAYVALVQYLTLCDGVLSDTDIAQQEETKALFLANENLSKETKASLETLFSDEKPMFFKTRKHLDAISTDDLTVLKGFVEHIYAENEAGNEQEQIAWDKFISYYDERTDKWHQDRSASALEISDEDWEHIRDFIRTNEENRRSEIKKAALFSAAVVGSVLLVGLGVALGKEVISTSSKVVPINEMSDKALLQKLKEGTGKNTGESVATRAHYIVEAYKRGLNF